MSDLTENLIYYAKKCDVENWADAMGEAANRIKALEAENEKLRAAFRATLARLLPQYTHTEIDAKIEREITE
jgi:hypothetical protein